MQGTDAVCTLSGRGTGWAVHHREVGRMRGFTRVLVASVALVMVAVACSSNSTAAAAARPRAGERRGAPTPSSNCEPTTLIPQNDYESCGSQAFQDLSRGSWTYDASTPVRRVPAQAESVDALVRRSGVHDRDQGRLDLPQRRAGDRQSYVDAWNSPRTARTAYILNTFFQQDRGLRRHEPRRMQERHDERDERSCGDRRHDLHGDPEGAVQPVPLRRSGSTRTTRCRRCSTTTPTPTTSSPSATAPT